MPSRRLRTSPRVVKRALSRYNARGKVDRATYKATIGIVILAADLPDEGEPSLTGLGVRAWWLPWKQAARRPRHLALWLG